MSRRKYGAHLDTVAENKKEPLTPALSPSEGEREMAAASRCTRFLLSLVIFCQPAQSVQIDPGKLPPPAPVKVEFERDIRPIFQSICWRCHGPEKPKSHFRLDNRELALKGGENNKTDIIPGNSTNSASIHYVCRLVEDMDMPAPVKGDPLTPEPIGPSRGRIELGVTG